MRRGIILAGGVRLDHPVRDLATWITRVRPSPANLAPAELADDQALIWQDGELYTLFTAEDTVPPTYHLAICRVGAQHGERSESILAAYVAAMGRPPDEDRHRRAVFATQVFHYWHYYWLPDAR